MTTEELDEWAASSKSMRDLRQRIFGDLPKTDEVDARVMARIGYLHEAAGEEFTLRPPSRLPRTWGPTSTANSRSWTPAPATRTKNPPLCNS